MMESILKIIHDVFFILFATGLTFISFKSLVGGFSFLSHFQKARKEDETSDRSPRVSILIPVRGVDEGLKENLEAVLDQEYPSFDVTVISDDEDDEALVELSDLISSCGIRVAITEQIQGQSGKISKLIGGVSTLPDETEVIVFADSDARPGRNWHRSLVNALDDESIGASTGYRWFLPSSPSIATEIRASWNASVASVLGPDPKKNFCWGGSTAMKREVFESLDIASRWRGALSDDYVVMRAIREAGLGIAFVPFAMTASIENCDFRGLMEFTTRQMKITRVYAPSFWIPALIGSAVHCITVLWGIAILLFSSDDTMRIVSALTLSIVWGLSVGKAALRVTAMTIAMPEHSERLARQRKWQMVLWAVTPFIFLYNCVAAIFSREVVWRGIRYRMVAPDKTEVL